MNSMRAGKAGNKYVGGASDKVPDTTLNCRGVPGGVNHCGPAPDSLHVRR